VAYWRKSPAQSIALQDVRRAQRIASTEKITNRVVSPLQEIITAQPAVLLGLIAQSSAHRYKMTSSALRYDCYALAKIFSRPQRRLRHALRQIAERGADDPLAPRLSCRTCIFCSTRAREHLPSVSRGHPSGLGLDWPEHGGTVDPVGQKASPGSSDHQFQTVVFRHFHTAANMASMQCAKSELVGRWGLIRGTKTLGSSDASALSG
jgi:hypothetical protein